MNWKDQVFYATAVANQPQVIVLSIFPSLTLGFPSPSSCTPAGNCMTLNPPGTASTRAVVLVAGRSLAAEGQPINRDRANIAHYLEDINRLNSGTAPSAFRTQASTANFNDIVLTR